MLTHHLNAATQDLADIANPFGATEVDPRKTSRNHSGTIMKPNIAKLAGIGGNNWNALCNA